MPDVNYGFWDWNIRRDKYQFGFSFTTKFPPKGISVPELLISGIETDTTKLKQADKNLHAANYTYFTDDEKADFSL
jgi:hypothetical protein